MISLCLRALLKHRSTAKLIRLMVVPFDKLRAGFGARVGDRQDFTKAGSQKENYMLLSIP